MNKAIFWDFDGTLAHRKGVYGQPLLDVLDAEEKGHPYQVEQIVPFLKGGFPWHQPDKSHLELNDPTLWWEKIEAVFYRAYLGIGCTEQKAAGYAKMAHLRYKDPTGFLVYDDTVETLEYFRQNGWRNLIVSNHVPELAEIVSGLGLERYIDDYISSACIGYEKPHPEIYRMALERAGNPKKVWMVGDNYNADVKGAENAGINAIFVRNSRVEGIKYYAKDLREVVTIIDSER